MPVIILLVTLLNLLYYVLRENNEMKRYIFAISATSIIAASIIQPNFAQAEKNITEIREERDEIKENLSEAEVEITAIMEEIQDITIEIKALNETLLQNEQAIKEVQAEIKDVEAEIAFLEDKIEERFQILTDRAKSYQESGGNVTYLEVILGAKNFNDFISRLNAITKITDSDAAIIEEQRKDKEKVENKLAELENLRMELKEIEELVTEQKETALDMKQQLEDKEDTLKKLVEELKIEDRELARMEANIFEESNSVTASMIDGTGVLGWPTEGGYISSYVGMRWGHMHKGIDIARTDRSTSPPIFAAEDGVVQTAGFNNGGYGNMVTINHGNGISTLYAHMASLSVKPGQQVKRGDQIGVMGTTGHSTGIHLHFEVHENGEFKNPIAYLR